MDTAIERSLERGADGKSITSLVLGIGNVLYSDDALGIRAVEWLSERFSFPENVRVLDLGTPVDLGHLLPGVSHLIVIDALQAGQEPGAIFRVRPEDLSFEPPVKTSLHQVGLMEGLAMASLLGKRPAEVIIIGVQPDSTGFGTELSPAVEAVLPEIGATVIRELERLGMSVRSKQEERSILPERV